MPLTARPLFTITLTYVNYLASRTPPPPPKNRAKSMDNWMDVQFVKIAAIAVGLSQAALILASICELLVVVGAQQSGFISDLIPYFLAIRPHHSAIVSNIELTPLAWLGWAIGTAGSLLRYWSINSLRGLFTFQLAVSSNHRLIKTGPYTCVRHPGYTGSIMSAIGTGLYFLGPGSYSYECNAWRTIPGIACILVWTGWKTFMVFNLFRRVIQEDEFLRKEFGQEWELWRNKVQYRLVPGVY